jgi:hypothetical protein
LKKKRFLPTLFCLFLLLNSVAGFTGYTLQDGFESGNFNVWTGTTKTSGETATVVDTVKYRGTYSAKFYCDGSSTGETAFAYKTVAPQTVCYARFYVRYETALPPLTGEEFMPFNLRNAAANKLIACVDAYHNGVNVFWSLEWRNGASAYRTITDVPVILNQWYCIEVYAKVASPPDGEFEFWIDGVSKVTQTGKDSDYYGSITVIQVGERYSSGTVMHNTYVDCVCVADDYVGPRINSSFYFSDGGVFFVNGTEVANGTSYEDDRYALYELGTHLFNSSFRFESFSWESGSSSTTPYNYIVLEETEVWANFRTSYMGGLPYLFYVGVALSVVGICSIPIARRRKK